MQYLPVLSTGEQNYEELRNRECIYVDKTPLIYRLIYVQKSKFNFLARPRRFGKSLLISTLKAIFESKQHLFEGLFIEDKIEWEKYPVIHFDFSKMGFRDIGLQKAIEKTLDENAAKYGVALQEFGIGLRFAELMQKLHEKTGKQVVVLIDEYDKPITDVLEVGKNEKAHDHRDILRTFYSVVKGNSEHIRFFFLTGIARFSKVSLFSDLNNLTDLANEKDYHNLLGYTQTELETYFQPHIHFIAEEQKITTEELLQKIKFWYNGFSWNGEDKLYNPYSILRFLSARVFDNFWFDSGTPKFLIVHLKAQMKYKIGKMTLLKTEAENFDIDNLSVETLLFQTGYLAVRGEDRTGRLILDYPNNEVELSMTQHILQSFAHATKSSMALDITIAVQNHDMELLIETINVLFAAIPYQLFDQHKEKYFHAILFLSFKLCGFFIESEVSVSTGRIDAVMKYENRVYIFEFKLNDTAENAIKQIHEKGYYKAYLQESKEIYLVGISFSSKTKEVEGWLLEKM